MEARKIIITGGATRIGAAIAKKLSGRNREILIHFNKSKLKAEKLKKELSNDGGAAEFRQGIASGGQAIKFRCFINKENASQFPNLVKFINELQSKETYETISKMINKDLSNSYVRVEVICDREGFWLKPHCDIKEKLMSGLIFVNNTNESEDLGTDFYNEKLEKVKTLPYKHNYGYLFTSGPNTWHGMEKKKIVKERRCIQVNYVTFETDWKVNS
ncbi:hypothetical protein OA073_01415 [Candidatus Pelagibacter sp.]|nr:hypothetical protein [Candidatus Pelagibacter sp.]